MQKQKIQEIADLLTNTGYMLGQEGENFSKQDYVFVLNEVEKIKDMVYNLTVKNSDSCTKMKK
jgi:exoribonuclease R